MAKEPFVIASHMKEYDNPLEYDLHNLQLRLKILKDWVAQTESQIEELERRLQE